MKKIVIRIAIPVIIAFLVGGCGVDKPVPPAATPGTPGTPGTPTPATVQVSLSAASITNGGTVTVTAIVTDASSVVMPNVSVNFSVISATAGTLTPAFAVTDASGVATSVFTATTPNTTATIRASVTVGTATISGSAPLTIGTPTQTPASILVSLSAPSIPFPPGSITVSARVSDASAAAISGVNVTFTVSSATAGSFSAGTASTNASGDATVTFNANAVAATVTITATVGTLNNSASLTIGSPPPPTPASITLSSNPLSLNIQGQSTVSATLLSTTGTPVSGATITFTITSGTTLGSFSATVSQLTITGLTNASGIASATFYAGASSGVVNIQGAATGVTAQNVSLNITSDPASITVSATNPSLLSGQATNIIATVRNVMNNPVTDGTTVTFAVTAGATNAGSFSATSATTVSGVASVTFTADLLNSGSLVITATSGAVSSTVLITVSAAATQSIEFVSAIPDIIGVSGSGIAASSLVTFVAKDSNGSPKPGVSVSFTLYGPTGATLAAPSGSTGLDGTVAANLQAGTVAGPARIVATTTLPSGATISTSSGNISIGGGVPSDRWFSIAINKFSLDGLTCNNVQSTISAYIADRFGNYNILQGTSVSFATDAGAIDTSNITDALGVTTSVYRTQDPRSTDVDPQSGEPFYTTTVSGVTHTYNPRDGRISILVSTTGEEHFVDANANGLYDLGETFTDLSEPFLDSNDNGAPDTGELFFDWPGGATGVPGATANVYNNANTVWDARIPIYRNVNLVLTGPPHFSTNTSRIQSALATFGSVTIAPGSSELFDVYVSDINMNTLIAGTTIALAADDSAAQITLLNGMATLADTLSTGPSVLTYEVKNKTTSAEPISVRLLATYDWPGTCGSLKATISYAGSVTLQPVPPPAPAITATAGPGAGEITLQWAPVTGATSYRIYYGTAPGLTTILIPGVITSGPYLHSGLTSSTTYYYTATSVNSSGAGLRSAETNAIAP